MSVESTTGSRRSCCFYTLDSTVSLFFARPSPGPPSRSLDIQINHPKELQG